MSVGDAHHPFEEKAMSLCYSESPKLMADVSFRFRTTLLPDLTGTTFAFSEYGDVPMHICYLISCCLRMDVEDLISDGEGVGSR